MSKDRKKLRKKHASAAKAVVKPSSKAEPKRQIAKRVAKQTKRATPASRITAVAPIKQGRVIATIAQPSPTQGAVGMRAVAAKREKISACATKAKRIQNYLEQRPIPAVKGPNGQLFMVDHHHMSLALLQNAVDTVFVDIIDDLSSCPSPRFWQRMEAAGRVYPYDETGQRIDPAKLPANITGLGADPYRDLAWSVRERGGYKKTQAPFSEFRWATFFRAHIAEDQLSKNYDRTVTRAIRLAKSDAADHLPGFRG